MIQKTTIFKTLIIIYLTETLKYNYKIQVKLLMFVKQKMQVLLTPTFCPNVLR